MLGSWASIKIFMNVFQACTSFIQVGVGTINISADQCTKARFIAAQLFRRSPHLTNFVRFAGTIAVLVRVEIRDFIVEPRLEGGVILFESDSQIVPESWAEGVVVARRWRNE